MIKMLLRSNKISLAGLRASRMIFEVGRLSKPGRRSGKVRFRRLERTRIFERPFIILRRTDPSGLRIALPTPEIPGGLIASIRDYCPFQHQFLPRNIDCTENMADSNTNTTRLIKKIANTKLPMSAAKG